MIPIRAALLVSAIVTAIFALAALALTPVAPGATFVVTKRGDPPPLACTRSDCSLREAVRAANATPAPDRIELPNRRRPYVLSQASTSEDNAVDGDLDVSGGPLAIRHRGKGRATIDANAVDRVLDVLAGAPTTLRKLVITGGGGPSASFGGGIRAAAGLTLIRGVVAGNRAAACGGGIHTESGAELVLRHSRVSGNEANGDGGESATAASAVRAR